MLNDDEKANRNVKSMILCEGDEENRELNSNFSKKIKVNMLQLESEFEQRKPSPDVDSLHDYYHFQ